MINLDLCISRHEIEKETSASRKLEENNSKSIQDPEEMVLIDSYLKFYNLIKFTKIELFKKKQALYSRVRSQEEEIHNLQEQIAAACLKVFNNNNNIMNL